MRPSRAGRAVGAGMLVRAARGRIFDVAVDARAGSPTFGRSAGVELSAASGDQLFVPVALLHGHATREVVYLVDAPYDLERETHLRWNDPDLAIRWGLSEDAATVSEKDAAAPLWSTFDTPFRYG